MQSVVDYGGQIEGIAIAASKNRFILQKESFLESF